MSYKRKPMYALLALGIAVSGALSYAQESSNPAATNTMPEQKAVQTLNFKINRYTQPEPAQREAAPAVIPSDYKLEAGNGNLELYVNRDSFSFMLKNKKNGYVWTSKPSDEIQRKVELNDEWKGAVNSPLIVEYFDAEAVLKRGNFQTLGGRIVEVGETPNGVKATLLLENISVTVSMELSLDGDSLVVKFPDADIKEEGDFRLASLQPFPFFGAVYKDSVPGYIFIPDVSGALIRFQKEHPRYDEPFRGRVYGPNDPIERTEFGWFDPIYMPVFGMVHGAERNAFLGIIEEGKYNANINAYPSGVNTDFYWVSPSFILRQAYFQPTSKNMGGFNTFEKKRSAGDKSVRYVLLEGADADYVGMAKTYRKYLIDKGMLTKRVSGQKNIPLLVEMLGAEIEPGFISNKLVQMTTFSQAKTIVDSLRGAGIDRMVTVFRGWNEGGYSGTNPDHYPVEGSLGGKKGLMELEQYLESEGIPLYLYSDYTRAYGDQDNFKVGEDAVRRPSNEIFEILNEVWYMNEKLWDLLNIKFVQPGKALKIAEEDAERLQDMGIGGVAIANTGVKLFSDYHANHTYTRAETAAMYGKLTETLKNRLGSVAFYEPNDYMWKYADRLFHIPMRSTQFMYSTDTVPFLQIVLHGYVEYYAPHANFNANPREDMLRMIEYGAYPSFYLTHEPSWKLKETPSISLFTSKFDDWKDRIAETYELANRALASVQDAEIVDRTVPEYGVVEVKYSNGVTILVNYTSKDVTFGGLTAKAQDFAVGGVKE